MKRNKVLIIIILLVLSLVCFFFGWKSYYDLGNDLEISIDNKNSIIDVSDFTITGNTTSDNVTVYLNDEKIDSFAVTTGKFEYKINPDLLIDGWNYIEFGTARVLNINEKYTGGAINNIKDQPDVFIPDKIIEFARMDNLKNRDKYVLDDNYDYYKNYIGAGNLQEGATFYFDDDGIPQIKMNDEIVYQPVFVSAYALNTYKEYLEKNDDESKEIFLKMADWFVNNHKNGALEYPVDWKVGTIELKKGWVSSMAEGRALSVLARAYYLTKDEKYLEAGNTILNFMITPADRYLKNGTRKRLYDFTNNYEELKKYNSYYLFDTYIGKPSSYVLNGNLFALLGLYDWYRLEQDDYGSSVAKTNFDMGIKSIEILLPYYDYYGWSSYGLNQYNNGDNIGLGNKYAHRCHLQLLYILYTKTNSEKFKYYVDRFLSYYEDDFWIQTDKMYKRVPTISIDNQNDIMDLSNYYVTGKTTGNIVEVYINNKKVDIVVPSQNSFKYKIDGTLLKEEWNYINFVSYDIEGHDSSSVGAMINNIKNQPDVFIHEDIVKEARNNCKKLREKYLLYHDYDYTKDYIGSGIVKESDTVKYDKNGIPQSVRDGITYYNPVTISGHALGLYKKYLNDSSNKNKNEFLHVADYYVNKGDNGAFNYDIEFVMHGIKLEKGFSSGMAQGRALSVLARAYYLTNDEKYLKAGKKVLDYMLSSADNDLNNGTSKKLYDFTHKYSELEKYNDYRIFEEYVSDPSSYVLNGDLFALLGLYDWSKAVSKEYGSEEAKKAFDDGIKSIEILLPYYDYYGMSSYDLVQYTNGSEPNLKSKYGHRCHIQLLYILADITHSEKLKYYCDRFIDYYVDDFWTQTVNIYYE